MGNEIEAQYLDINKDEIREKLASIGAVCVKPEIKMRRTMFDTGEHSFARVRDEGDKVVMTYKNVEDDYSILGTKEVNVVVDDYDKAVMYMRACGLTEKAVQETLREVWVLGNVEFSIDTWPWLPVILEIEAPTEAEVWDASEKLGLKKEDAKFGSVDTTYQYYYGVDLDVVDLQTPIINFEIDPPEWARKRIR